MHIIVAVDTFKQEDMDIHICVLEQMEIPIYLTEAIYTKTELNIPILHIFLANTKGINTIHIQVLCNSSYSTHTKRSFSIS